MINWQGALAALGVGLIGAVGWASLAYSGRVDVFVLAWAIGGGVGFAFNFGAAKRSPINGLVAATIAFMALVGGRVLVVNEDYNDEADVINNPRELRAFVDDLLREGDMLTACLADHVIADGEADGKTYMWPAGQMVESATKRQHYPDGVWDQAVTRWESMPLDEQSRFRLDARENMILSGSVGLVPKPQALVNSVLSSLRPIDMIFGGLALVTASILGASAGKPASSV